VEVAAVAAEARVMVKVIKVNHLKTAVVPVPDHLRTGKVPEPTFK
jgi:hypothetical protein